MASAALDITTARARTASFTASKNLRKGIVFLVGMPSPFLKCPIRNKYGYADDKVPQNKGDKAAVAPGTRLNQAADPGRH
jgi:hypothetical protein